jgi:hypothetical protein
LWPQIETNDPRKVGVYFEDILKMTNDESQKPTPEMLALAANYVGEVKRIPAGKRTRRGPSKKSGVSGSLQGSWTAAQERLAFGDSNE